MILLIDNFDSFTYNLVHLIGTVSTDVFVLRTDKCNLKEIKKLNPTHIIISSGTYKQSGVCEKIILDMKEQVPILGIGLGHHIIGEVFGAKIVPANPLVYGKPISIHIASGNRIFNGLSPIIQAGGYYSKVIQRESLPDELLVIGENEHEEIMAVKHRDFDVYGLQFNPESILTLIGEKIIRNFFKIGGGNS